MDIADASAGATAPPTEPTVAHRLWAVAATIAVGACAFHGYKRNASIPWAVGWAALGGIAPVIAVPVALAQGFGKRSK